MINLRNALMTSGKKPAYWGLCFTAEEAGSTIALIKVSSAPAVTLQTSTDGKSWTPYTIGDVITLGAIGDSIFFAAGEDGNTRLGSSTIRYHQFSMTGKIAAAGNIMSLLSADEPQPQITGTYTFYRLFSGCTSLTAAPELPATTLAASCYQQMFSGCTSLTTAPELPATTLAASCYNSMFSGCTSLSDIKVYFTAWGSQTTNWVDGVAASGVFECPDALPHTASDFTTSKIPPGWTVETF